MNYTHLFFTFKMLFLVINLTSKMEVSTGERNMSTGERTPLSRIPLPTSRTSEMHNTWALSNERRLSILHFRVAAQPVVIFSPVFLINH